MVPQYTRIDAGVPTVLTAEQIHPFVLEAMRKYFDLLSEEYGGALLEVQEAVNLSLREHKLVLINEEYLLGYIVGSEWYSRELILQEEFLIRVGQGATKLTEVFQAMKALALLEGAKSVQVGTRAASNKEAIRRLYRRYGMTEIMTVMRC